MENLYDSSPYALLISHSTRMVFFSSATMLIAFPIPLVVGCYLLGIHQRRYRDSGNTNGLYMVHRGSVGFIGSVECSYCWVESSLVVAGQDGTPRELTFRESLF